MFSAVLGLLLPTAVKGLGVGMIVVGSTLTGDGDTVSGIAVPKVVERKRREQGWASELRHRANTAKSSLAKNQYMR